MVKFLVAFLIATQSIWGSAYTLEPGALFTGLATEYMTFQNITDSTRKKITLNNRIHLYRVAAFLEYGIIDDLDAGFVLPFDSYQGSKNATHALTGIGDFELHAKYRILREEKDYPFTLALQLRGSVPIAKFQPSELAGPGDAVPDATTMLLASRYFSISSWLFYLNAGSGYYYRSGSLNSSLVFSLEGGAIITDELSVFVPVQSFYALGGIDLESKEFKNIVASTSKTPFDQLSETYIKMGLGVSYQLTNSLNLTFVYSNTLLAVNSSLQQHFSLYAGNQFF